MPLTKGEFKCLHCDDTFQGNSNDFTKCACGKTEVKPHMFSTSYKPGSEYRKISSSTEYSQSDFFQMDSETLEVYEEVKKTAKELGFFVHEMTEKDNDGKKLVSTVNVSKSEPINTYTSEMNEIELRIGFSYEYDNPNGENIKKRLNLFLKVLHMLKSEKLNLQNRTQLKELSETNDTPYNSEQVKEYSYTFYY